MTITLKVPSIACEGCATTITKAIQKGQEGAQVIVDVAQKLVSVETSATVAQIQQLIESAGYAVTNELTQKP